MKKVIRWWKNLMNVQWTIFREKRETTINNFSLGPSKYSKKILNRVKNKMN